jgi:hypothetical protein
MAPLKLITMAALCAALHAQTRALLLDHSGSMKPFYASGLVPQLAQEILNSYSGQAKVKLYAFGTTVTRMNSLDELKSLPYGQDTYLDRAMMRPIDDGDSIVWIITDNIEDRPEDGSAGNTEAFYSILRGSAVREVVVCPYNLSPGTTGLAIYAILLADSADPEFERELQAFRKTGRGEREIEALPMKPLGKDTVYVVNGRAAASAPRTFEEGAEVSHRIEITFQSRFQHLRIVDSDVRATSAEPRFQDKSLLAPEKHIADIKPNKIRVLEPGGETVQKYEVTINLGPVRLKPGLTTLFKAAFRGGGEDIELQVPLEIAVPAQNFQFKESFLKAYHSDTMEDAKATGRIYGLQKLPILLSDSATKIETEAPFRFHIQYPRRAAVVVVLLCVVALAVLVMAIWALIAGIGRIGSSGWDADVMTDYLRPVESSLNDQGQLFAEGAPLAVIHGRTCSPAMDSVQIEPAGDRARVSDGARVTIKRGRETFLVTFKKKQRVAAEAGEPQIYKER